MIGLSGRAGNPIVAGQLFQVTADIYQDAGEVGADGCQCAPDALASRNG